MIVTMKPNQLKAGTLRAKAKVIFAGLVLLILAGPLFGQASSYVIESVGTYDQVFFENSILNGKWDAYRKPMSRVTLQFDKGARVVLLSGNELTMAGVAYNGAVMLPENAQLNPQRQFSLHSSGIVLEALPVKSEK